MSRRAKWLILWLVGQTLGLAAVVLWWWLRNRRVRAPLAPAPQAPARPALELVPAAEKPAPVSEKTAPISERAAPTAPDDLAKLKGIGAKSADVLNGGGITTFGQLAEAEVQHLAELLRSAGVRVRHLESWPKQAALAAAGEWKKLQRLQNKLQ
jgi:predicted flap endonuclease-1-like 5' DNA nuclease